MADYLLSEPFDDLSNWTVFSPGSYLDISYLLNIVSSPALAGDAVEYKGHSATAGGLPWVYIKIGSGDTGFEGDYGAGTYWEHEYRVYINDWDELWSSDLLTGYGMQGLNVLTHVSEGGAIGGATQEYYLPLSSSEGIIGMSKYTPLDAGTWYKVRVRVTVLPGSGSEAQVSEELYLDDVLVDGYFYYYSDIADYALPWGWIFVPPVGIGVNEESGPIYMDSMTLSTGSVTAVPSRACTYGTVDEDFESGLDWYKAYNSPPDYISIPSATPSLSTTFSRSSSHSLRCEYSEAAYDDGVWGIGTGNKPIGVVDEVWLRYYVYLPSVSALTAGYAQLLGFDILGGGYPGNQFSPSVEATSAGDGRLNGMYTSSLVDFPVGEWNEIILGMKSEKHNDDSFSELWLNGTMVESVTGDNSGTAPGGVFGIMAGYDSGYAEVTPVYAYIDDVTYSCSSLRPGEGEVSTFIPYIMSY